MDFHQIFRGFLPQEDLELIRFWGVSGNNCCHGNTFKDFQVLFYLGIWVTFNTVQVISWWVVGRAEETSTYTWSRFCTVNCRPMASNYQLSNLRSGRDPNLDLRQTQRREVSVLWVFHRLNPCTNFHEIFRVFLTLRGSIADKVFWRYPATTVAMATHLRFSGLIVCGCSTP